MKSFLSAAAAIAMAAFLSSCCGQPDINGAWTVTSVAGEQIALPDSLAEATPYIEFNAENGRVHGYTGCNIMNGTYTLDGSDLSLGQMATTMMAGPQELMELESKVLDAVNGAASVQQTDDDSLQILDGEGNVTMVLVRKAATEPETSVDGQAEVAE